MKQVEKLTFREYEVAYLIYQGWNNQEIADYLFLSIRTIESHISSIFKKLSISTRVKIVSFFNFKNIPNYGGIKSPPRKLRKRCPKLFIHNCEAHSLKEWAIKKNISGI